MTNRSYNPTNYRFTDHTKRLVGTKTKKGHLGEDKKDETHVDKGILVRIVRSKIYSDGWEVKVGKDKNAKIYKCYYGDNITYIPESRTTELYFIPKNECEVILSRDEKSGIYTIKRINDPKKKPITFFESQLILQAGEGSGVTITDESTDISSDTNVDGSISSTGDIKSEGSIESTGDIKSDGDIKSTGTITSDNDVVVKTEEDEEDISLRELYKQMKEIQITVDEMSSGTNE